VNRAATSCAAALEVLGDRGSSLRTGIERTFGISPSLRVLSSARSPAPAWAAPLLPAGEEVLLRRTAYRVRRALVSRHLAALLVSACGVDRVAALEVGRISLAEVLAEPGVETEGHHAEVAETQGERDLEPAVAIAADGLAGVVAWRRYVVTIGGSPAAVVVEVVPCATWERILRRPHPSRAGSR